MTSKNDIEKFKNTVHDHLMCWPGMPEIIDMEIEKQFTGPAPRYPTGLGRQHYSTVRFIFEDSVYIRCTVNNTVFTYTPVWTHIARNIAHAYLNMKDEYGMGTK